ncbi:hypothetical protein HA466_0095650 [Hirschfeldia incana]|nr:hypothetical protein HA466_0095650 [Hirschfeldia incana]
MVKLTADLIWNRPHYFFNTVGGERCLDLRGYGIPEIENLGATEFDTIDLSDNEIVKLENFPLLNRLGTLIIKNNWITQINPNIGEFLPKLHTLNLAKNRLVNLVEIDPLASIPKLQRLWLLDNAIIEKPNYRLYVIHKLKSLRLLDFIRVEAKERDEAAALFSSEIQKVPESTEEPETSTLVALTREQILPFNVRYGKASSGVNDGSDPMEVDEPTFSIPVDTMTTNEPEHEEIAVTTGESTDLQGDSSRIDHPPQFDGFDEPTVGHVSSYGLRDVEYARYWYPSDAAFVKVYAKLGLHRYNLLEGTNYQFSHLQSYNKGINAGAAPYFLTLFASDPDSGTVLPYHALVRENQIGLLDVSVNIARPRGFKEKPRLCPPTYTCSPLPRWPSSEMFAQQRFYTLTEHEVQNTDWVRLYLDLAHSTCDRGMTESQLSDFHIERVVIQSLSDAVPPRLDSKSLVVYMVYKDLAKARLREPCFRKAIIRRVYYDSSGSLTFRGKHWSFSEEKEKKKKEKEKKRFALLKRRLGVWGAWRLGLDVYRKRGISSSRTR